MTNEEQAAYLKVLQVESSLQRENFQLFRAAMINYLQRQLDNNMIYLNNEGG